MIAAGTGLGEAGLIWNGECYHAVATEGSHSDFGPRSALQVELYTFLASDGHVSYEDVCSGIGLVTLYRFLRERSRTDEPSLARRRDPRRRRRRDDLECRTDRP